MTLPFQAILIDDEDWIREGLTEHVHWHSLGIMLLGSYKDGTEAMSYLQTHPVDLILSDIRMPNMSGLELLRWLRENSVHMPHLLRTKVIFLSGYGEFQYAQEALRLGASDFLLKPANVEIIEESLARAKTLWQAELALSQGNDEGLSRLKLENGNSHKDATHKEATSYLISKAMELIQEHYAVDYQLAQIAEQLYISPNYLSRLFRQETGKPYSEHLSQIRLEKACELLLSTTNKIYHVGEQVGYMNPKYFSEWFQKQTGLSPVEYRNKLTASR